MPRKKQLPAVIERPDIAARDRLRKLFMERFEADFDFWYQAMQAQVMFPSKEGGAAVQMLRVIMERILPEERVTAPKDDGARGKNIGGGGVIKIYNVNRGTRGARTAAIQLKRDQRGSYSQTVPDAAANDS